MKNLCFLTMCVLSSMALAQDDPCVLEAKAKPLAVRVGLGTFTNKSSNDFTRDSHFSLGLTYRPGISCMVAPMRGTPGFDLDFFDVTGNGNRISSLGLTFGTRILLGADGGIYGGFGVGAFSGTLRAAGGGGGGSARLITRATGDDVAAGSSKTMVRPGAKLMLGMNGKSGEFYELNYFLMPKVRGGDINRATLSVGFKF